MSTPPKTPRRCARVASGLALLLFLGCDGEPTPDAGMARDAGRDAGGSGRAPCGPDGGPVDAGLAQGLTGECAEAFVLTGLGLRFAEEAEPLSRFAVFPHLVENVPDGCPPSATLRGATLVADLGASGAASATYAVVGVGEAPPPDGGTFAGIRTARGTATVDLVAEPEATALALFDLARAGLADAPHIAVVLDGIELDTDLAQSPDYPPDYDPADGYTVRGVGASIEGVEREGDDLSITVGALFALGRSDEPALNRALPVARTRVVVHYLVAALPAAPVEGSVAYREQHRGHGDELLEVCRPPAEVTALEIAGGPSAHAAPALTRFAVRLFPDEAPEGDRLRELSLRIGGFVWDPGTRRATMQVEGYASNAGPPSPRLPMDYEVEATVALLQWSEGGAATALRYDAPIEPGRNALSLPLTER